MTLEDVEAAAVDELIWLEGSVCPAGLEVKDGSDVVMTALDDEVGGRIAAFDDEVGGPGGCAAAFDDEVSCIGAGTIALDDESTEEV